MQFSGHDHLRTRLVLSLLSGKSLKVTGIRSQDKDPGLRGLSTFTQEEPISTDRTTAPPSYSYTGNFEFSPDYEVSLLRLVEKVTNGSHIEISSTGTSFLLKPGVMIGGPITHDCPLSRSVGYFLELVIPIACFMKKPLALTLRGITTDDKDFGVDLIRTVTLPHLTLFGIEDGVEFKIKKRGAPPGGGGEVQLITPVVKTIKTLNFVEKGKIKRIRGIAHAVRVSPQFSSRLIDSARSVLNRYIPDIYLHSDVYKGPDSGNSPGYALSLLAESTTGVLHCSEAVSIPRVTPNQSTASNAKVHPDRLRRDDNIFGPNAEERRGPEVTTPEDVGVKAARELLLEVQRGGCVDRKHQWLVLLFMALGSEDVGRIRMGELSARTIQFLRDLKTAFGTSFKIVPTDPNNESCTELLLSCYGTGFVNVNRAAA